MRQFAFFVTLILASCTRSTEKGTINKIGDRVSPNSTDRLAEFPGGQASLNRFIGDNWKWKEPTDTIEGYVYVSFIVKRDSTIEDVRIKKGICYSCDEEALRLIRSMPRWIPSIKDGQTIDQNYVLPIMFQSSTVKGTSK